jgi:hypothetical protein
VDSRQGRPRMEGAHSIILDWTCMEGSTTKPSDMSPKGRSEAWHYNYDSKRSMSCVRDAFLEESFDHQPEDRGIDRLTPCSTHLLFTQTHR